MPIASLGSGSRGNATLVRVADRVFLIDCGFPLKHVRARCAELEVEPEQISAILVTHEHGDHLSGVGVLAAKYGLPVYMTSGTARQWKDAHRVDLRILRSDEPFEHAGVKITPVAVPHDAREPVQYRFDHQSTRIGVLTDLGSITPHLIEAFTGCELMLIEANHDKTMLLEGEYPPALKRRVGGDWGHLNNQQTLELVRTLHSRHPIQQLVVGHISEHNNCVERIKSLMDDAELSIQQIHYAEQHRVMPWIAAH